MKIRKLLAKLNDIFRPMHIQGSGSSLQVGEGLRAGEDNVDALAAGISPGHGDTGAGDIPALAPPNWVPSQQDERPRY
jgi:hypothetical protein